MTQDVKLAELKTTVMAANEVLNRQESVELAAELDSVIISFNDQCSVLLGMFL